MNEVTRILADIDRGVPQAAERLFPLVYDELRALAAQKLAHEKPGQTLQATALVHDAYLRMVGGVESPNLYRDRGHFFAAVAAAMRHILIDNARRKLAKKRGGGALCRQPLDNLCAPARCEELLALDEALEKLSKAQPQNARLVELRYFAGLTGEQAAAVLGISPITADRHWSYARAWLQAEIRRGV
jgi:RNA polymerase sigma factor (TIGR02999 family)